MSQRSPENEEHPGAPTDNSEEINGLAHSMSPWELHIAFARSVSLIL